MFIISIPLFQSFNPLFSLRLNLKLLLTSTFYRVERYLHVIQLMKSIIGRNVLMQFLNSFWKVQTETGSKQIYFEFSFSFRSHRTALKLFSVVPLYGWQGWTWIKLRKSSAVFFTFWCYDFKNHQKVLLLVFPYGISVILVPLRPASLTRKNPQRQNNLWYVSRRMKRSIDQSEHVYL